VVVDTRITGHLALPADIAYQFCDPVRRTAAGRTAGGAARRRGCSAALVRPDHYVFGTASNAQTTAALVEAFAAATT